MTTNLGHSADVYNPSRIDNPEVGTTSQQFARLLQGDILGHFQQVQKQRLVKAKKDRLAEIYDLLSEVENFTVNKYLAEDSRTILKNILKSQRYRRALFLVARMGAGKTYLWKLLYEKIHELTGLKVLIISPNKAHIDALDDDFSKWREGQQGDENRILQAATYHYFVIRFQDNPEELNNYLLVIDEVDTLINDVGYKGEVCNQVLELRHHAEIQVHMTATPWDWSHALERLGEKVIRLNYTVKEAPKISISETFLKADQVDIRLAEKDAVLRNSKDKNYEFSLYNGFALYDKDHPDGIEEIKSGRPSVSTSLLSRAHKIKTDKKRVLLTIVDPNKMADVFQFAGRFEGAEEIHLEIIWTKKRPKWRVCRGAEDMRQYESYTRLAEERHRNEKDPEIKESLAKLLRNRATPIWAYETMMVFYKELMNYNKQLKLKFPGNSPASVIERRAPYLRQLENKMCPLLEGIQKNGILEILYRDSLVHDAIRWLDFDKYAKEFGAEIVEAEPAPERNEEEYKQRKLALKERRESTKKEIVEDLQSALSYADAQNILRNPESPLRLIKIAQGIPKGQEGIKDRKLLKPILETDLLRFDNWSELYLRHELGGIRKQLKRIRSREQILNEFDQAERELLREFQDQFICGHEYTRAQIEDLVRNHFQQTRYAYIYATNKNLWDFANLILHLKYFKGNKYKVRGTLQQWNYTLLLGKNYEFALTDEKPVNTENRSAILTNNKYINDRPIKSTRP